MNRDERAFRHALDEHRSEVEAFREVLNGLSGPAWREPWTGGK
jgi:hypothetical protein